MMELGSSTTPGSQWNVSDFEELLLNFAAEQCKVIEFKQTNVSILVLGKTFDVTHLKNVNADPSAHVNLSVVR